MIRCYITDRLAFADDDAFLNNLEHIASSVEWIQLREKDLEGRELLALARAVRARCGHAKLLVNSRLDVALSAGAYGLHLPANSVAAVNFRSAVPRGFVIGVSCHSQSDLVAAEREGADYALFSPIFTPISKPARDAVLGLYALRSGVTAVKIPVLALGGMTAERARQCVEAGAAGYASISMFQIVGRSRPVGGHGKR